MVLFLQFWPSLVSTKIVSEYCKEKKENHTGLKQPPRLTDLQDRTFLIRFSFVKIIQITSDSFFLSQALDQC